jgi:spermidine/putrescine transport system permease protein
MNRKASWGLKLYAWAVYGFLYLPIIVLAVFSFNKNSVGTAWKGFTFQWYSQLFQNEVIASVTENTLILALSSTVISTVIGSLLGYGLYRFRFPGSRLFNWVMYVPVVSPDIVLAVGFLLTYSLLRVFLPFFELGMTTMILAHVSFQISFVAITVRSRIAGLDEALEEASRDLYASSWDTLLHVVLPLAVPGILAGALLAFTLSIDDFVISFFTSGPQSTTLPMLIYSSVRRGINPSMNALSTIIVLLTVMGVVGSRILRRSPGK